MIKSHKKALSPLLLKEWHPTKNGALKPEDITAGSNKKAWWKCSKGDDHEWEAIIGSRTSGRGCPYCANYKVSKENNLSAKHPDIAKEWHPTKNGALIEFHNSNQFRRS